MNQPSKKDPVRMSKEERESKFQPFKNNIIKSIEGLPIEEEDKVSEIDPNEIDISGAKDRDDFEEEEKRPESSKIQEAFLEQKKMLQEKREVQQ